MLLLCKLSDVPVGGAKRIARGRLPAIAVFNVDGVLHATDDRCTHGTALLSRGKVVEGRLICPLHFGSFHLATGAAVDLPCETPLRVYRVELVNGLIYCNADQ
jgi:nitrite reductase/ring-hydroxylating ferredoxin subunit